MPSNFNDIIADAELYQKHFVAPVVDQMKQEMQAQLAPLVKDVADLKAGKAETLDRVKKLENNQGKALKGYAVYTTVAATAMASGWSWIKSHFKLT